MAPTAMTTTPAATVRAAYSLTGFGNLNTWIVYRVSRVSVRGALGLSRPRRAPRSVPAPRAAGVGVRSGRGHRALEQVEPVEARESVDPTVDPVGHGLAVLIAEQVGPEEVDLPVGDHAAAHRGPEPP